MLGWFKKKKKIRTPEEPGAAVESEPAESADDASPEQSPPAESTEPAAQKLL